MNLKSLFLAVDVTFLQPLVDFLNDWYIDIILVLVAVGIIYAIVLGVNLAKSDAPETRERMKKRIINASLTIVIIVVLTFGLNFVLSNLHSWVNGGYEVIVTDEGIDSASCVVGNKSGLMSWNNDKKQFEAYIGNSTGVFSVLFRESSDKFKFASNSISEFGDVRAPEILEIKEDSPEEIKLRVPVYEQSGSDIYGYYDVVVIRTIVEE